jgi:hypothetical protein
MEWVHDRNCHSLLYEKNVDGFWSIFKSELALVQDKFVPKYKKRKNKCMWVMKQVVRARKEKVRAWNNYIRSGRDQNLYDIYKTKLRLSVKENGTARNFEDKLAST